MTEIDPDAASNVYRTILIPTDDSDGAHHAVEHALALAEAVDATVHAISVVEGSADAQRDQLRTDPEDLAEQAVETVAGAAERQNVPVRTATPSGVPEETILEYVEDNDVDMVVMGTHGRTGLKQTVFGSVAEGVVHNSPVPVVTVRPPD